MGQSIHLTKHLHAKVHYSLFFSCLSYRTVDSLSFCQKNVKWDNIWRSNQLFPLFLVSESCVMNWIWWFKIDSTYCFLVHLGRWILDLARSEVFEFIPYVTFSFLVHMQCNRFQIWCVSEVSNLLCLTSSILVHFECNNILQVWRDQRSSNVSHVITFSFLVYFHCNRPQIWCVPTSWKFPFALTIAFFPAFGLFENFPRCKLFDLWGNQTVAPHSSTSALPHFRARTMYQLDR
jgi:hypothetical protein